MEVRQIQKDDLELEDDLEPEYDLKSLKVRKMGAGRKNFAGAIVQLDPDVAVMFPNADAVNEALRFLIRATKESPNSSKALDRR